MGKEKQGAVVIGASIAGLFAAYRLAQEGMSVRVYEAQPAFAPDPRTLIVTPAWLRLLDFDPGDAVLNRTHTFELISRADSVRIPLREPDVILDRARFLRLLARRVQEAGGELAFGHRFEGIEERNSSSLLRFRNGDGEEQVVASTVIGADGVHSGVARAAGMDGLERVAILQARVLLPPDLSRDTVRVWFDRTSTRFFYWLIPESCHVGAAGLIAETPGEAKRALERFLAAHDLEPIEHQAAWVPLPPFRFGAGAPARDGRILLAGDAAGQVKVTTVGGVVMGMRGAQAVARSLVHRTSYEAELGPLRRELNFHALVRRVLDGFTDEDYDDLLHLLNQGALRVLSRYNRDELARALWHLLPAQPRWLLLGARALVRGFRGTGRK